jgi:hypothetical protein
VDYLLSLNGANYPLEEAPVDQPFTSSLPKPAPAAAPAAPADAGAEGGADETEAKALEAGK